MSERKLITKSAIDYAFNQAEEMKLSEGESVMFSSGIAEFDICITNDKHKGICIDFVSTIKRNFVVYPLLNQTND